MPSASPCIFCAFRANSLRNTRRLQNSARYRLKSRQVHSSAVRSQIQNLAFRTNETTEQGSNSAQTGNQQPTSTNWRTAPRPALKWAKPSNAGNANAPQPNAAGPWGPRGTASQSQPNLNHTPSPQTNLSSPADSASRLNWPNGQGPGQAMNGSASMSTQQPVVGTMPTTSPGSPWNNSNNASDPWRPKPPGESPWASKTASPTSQSPPSADSPQPHMPAPSQWPPQSTSPSSSPWTASPSTGAMPPTAPSGSQWAPPASSNSTSFGYTASMASKWAQSANTSQLGSASQGVAQPQNAYTAQPSFQTNTAPQNTIYTGNKGQPTEAGFAQAPPNGINRWARRPPPQANVTAPQANNIAASPSTQLLSEQASPTGWGQTNQTGPIASQMETSGSTMPTDAPSQNTELSIGSSQSQPYQNTSTSGYNPWSSGNASTTWAPRNNPWGSSTAPSVSNNGDQSQLWTSGSEVKGPESDVRLEALPKDNESTQSQWARPHGSPQGQSREIPEAGNQMAAPEGNMMGQNQEALYSNSTLGQSNVFTAEKMATITEQPYGTTTPTNWTSTVEVPRNWASIYAPNDQPLDDIAPAVGAPPQPIEPTTGGYISERKGSGQSPGIDLSGLYGALSGSQDKSQPRATNWARTKPTDSTGIDPSKPTNWGAAGGSSILEPKYHVNSVSFAQQPGASGYPTSSAQQFDSPKPRSFTLDKATAHYNQEELAMFESLVQSTEAAMPERNIIRRTKFENNGRASTSWAQQAEEQRSQGWMQQSQDGSRSSWRQREPQNGQYNSWMQQRDIRDSSERDYDNGRRTPVYNQEEEGYSSNAGRYRKSSSFQDGEREAPLLPSRSRRDAEEDAKWTKKRKDFKNKDREKHGRGFITDDMSIEEEMRHTMAVQKAMKKEPTYEPRKLPEVYLPEYISVGNLAHILKAHLDPFMRKLQELGFEHTNPEYVLNAENAGLIAMEYNFDPKIDTSAVDDLFPQPPVPDKSVLPLRPPVVTIMGHVDHGKTTILDWLRKSSIAAGEAGGITQHIGAFSVTMPSGKVITFLDTPGHAAFLTMRERGANVTDIVILVVAADDGVMPQTIEAIKHAQAAKVPIIVAVNKCDKPDANPDRVKQALGQHGLEIEDYGGDTQVIHVSGLTGLGMEDLEEATVLLSEVLDMRADPTGPCEGWVIESTTKKRGRVATILVRCGTLKVGDVLVAGTSWTRVRTLMDEHGRELESVGPGTPVEIDGWRNTPVAGDEVLQAPSEERAKSVVDFRNVKLERLRQAADMEAINEARRKERERAEREAYIAEQAKLGIEVTEEAPKEEEGSKTIIVPFIIKADVYGSVEAVSATILGIGNDEIQSRILRSGVGPLTQSDIDFAATVGAKCITFNVETDPAVEASARTEKIEILEHNIIYKVEEQVRELMSKKLPPLVTRTVTGEADVAQIFEYTIRGRNTIKVAGCKVRNGVVKRNSKVRVMRKNKVVYDGVLVTLKNVKKDVPEMKKNTECGLSVENWQEFKEGDVVQCYDEISTPRTL